MAHCRDIVVVLTPEMLREVFGVKRRVELGLALFYDVKLLARTEVEPESDAAFLFAPVTVATSGFTQALLDLGHLLPFPQCDL